MICRKCGTSNVDGNKFCTNCGNELLIEKQQQKNICESCGSENKPTSKYCTVCGEKLKTADNIKDENTKQNFQHRQKNNKWKNKTKGNTSIAENKKHAGFTIGVKPLLTAVVVLFISLATIAIINKWFYKSEEDLYPTESKSSNPVVEAKVFEIASKFVCSCGSCGEQSLEKCKCATAVEERQFVRDYLERKSKPEDIVVALADRYGYLKAEYAKEFKVDSSKTWSSTKLRPL